MLQGFHSFPIVSWVCYSHIKAKKSCVQSSWGSQEKIGRSQENCYQKFALRAGNRWKQYIEYYRIVDFWIEWL
jgi:hypothetical protein